MSMTMTMYTLFAIISNINMTIYISPISVYPTCHTHIIYHEKYALLLILLHIKTWLYESHSLSLYCTSIVVEGLTEHKPTLQLAAQATTKCQGHSEGHWVPGHREAKERERADAEHVLGGLLEQIGVSDNEQQRRLAQGSHGGAGHPYTRQLWRLPSRLERWMRRAARRRGEHHFAAAPVRFPRGRI